MPTKRSAKEKSSTRRFDTFWSIFGRISAVVVALAAVVTLIAYLIPNKPRISALATRTPYKTLPDIVTAIDSLKESESQKALTPYLNQFFAKNWINDADTRSLAAVALASSLENRFQTAIGTKYISGFEGFGSQYYYDIQISNWGGLSAKNAALVLPVDGQYSLSTNRGPSSSASFGRQINLGEIRPGDKISLAVWTSGDFFFYDSEKDWHVTYEDGSARVSFSIPAFGFWRFMIENNVPILVFFFMVMGIAALIFFGVRSSSSQQKTKKTGARKRGYASARIRTNHLHERD